MNVFQNKRKVSVDTNVIIRALVDKNDLFFTILETSKEVYIPLPIFFETIFVLERQYKITRQKIFAFIVDVMSSEKIITELKLLNGTLNIYLINKKLSIIDSFLITYSKINNLEIISLDKMLLKKA